MSQIQHPLQAVNINGAQQDDHVQWDSLLAGSSPVGTGSLSPAHVQVQSSKQWESSEDGSFPPSKAARKPWWKKTMTWSSKGKSSEGMGFIGYSYSDDDAMQADDLQDERARITKKRRNCSHNGLRGLKAISGAALL